MNILLVDDDPFTLKMLARQLLDLGCADVLGCEHAEDALACLREAAPGHYPLVFCDLQMPDMDGVQFVRHLSATPWDGSLVLLSGEDERTLQAVHRLAQARRVHVLDAVSKPVTTERLQLLLAAFEARLQDVAEANPGPALLPADLRRAIETDQLVLRYQPKVDFASGALVGVEALVRWQHPELGLVPPDRFVGMAEDHALIDELTTRVLSKALQQARRWKEAGLDLQLAVNISMRNLDQLDFPDDVALLADAAGIAHSRLTLEVTESRLMQDLRAPLDILMRLRLKRICLSIDDFGTGHSSLAQLRDVPFDELKLDRSFINGAVAEPRLGAIVEGTLAMARQLGIKTVAEGIEDQADWDYLRGLGCDQAQGYLIARPMPGDELLAWQSRWDAARADPAAG